MRRIIDPTAIKRLAADISQNNGEVYPDVNRVWIGMTSHGKMTILMEERDGTALFQELPFKISPIEIGALRMAKRQARGDAER